MAYKILLIPIAAGVLAQGIKLIIRMADHHRLRARDLVAYSGMPSGHSAIVASLAATIGLELGFDSPLFAFAFVFAFVVIRDALGIRRYLGQHGHVLNILVKDLKEDEMLDAHYPHLLERIGHTPAQVLVGILIGLAFSLLGAFL